MGLKMKNVNIMGVYQFLGEEGGSQKTIYMANCLKRGAWTIYRGLGKNREEGVFERGVGERLIHRWTL